MTPAETEPALRLAFMVAAAGALGGIVQYLTRKED